MRNIPYIFIAFFYLDVSIESVQDLKENQNCMKHFTYLKNSFSIELSRNAEGMKSAVKI